MPLYLVHMSGERARLRHRIFAQANKKWQAIEILKKMEGIAGIKPGSNSLLIFLETGKGNLKSICEKLEQAFPELTEAASESVNKTCRCRPSSQPKTVQSDSMRHIELKSLLLSGATTLGLAICGFYHLHAFAGGIFSLITMQHVWQRRRRL